MVFVLLCEFENVEDYFLVEYVEILVEYVILGIDVI